MKKTLKLSFILTTFVLYGFVISLYNGSALTGNSSFLQPDFQSEYYNSSTYSNLLYHTVQSESSTLIFRQTPTQSLKNFYNGFTASLKNIQQLFINTFSQYHFYSKNLLIRLQNTDIIFPFHSFW